MDYLLLLDESESEASAIDRFFVYGGLLVPTSQIQRLHEGLVRVRTTAGLPRATPLKWNMDRPVSVSKTALESAKAAVPPLVVYCQATLFASPVLREIADAKKRVGQAHVFGINTLLSAVADHLEERNAFASVLIDRLPSLKLEASFDLLGDHMSYGMGKRDADPKVERVLSYGYADAGCSRIASALDICLGLFTKAVGRPSAAPWDAGARSACSLLARRTDGGVLERGLAPRPVRMLSRHQPSYQRMYDRLRALGVAIR